MSLPALSDSSTETLNLALRSPRLSEIVEGISVIPSVEMVGVSVRSSAQG